MASRRHPRTFLPKAFAEVDLQRQDRLGAPEVIYGAGKTPSQILAIARRLRADHQPVLVTRVEEKKASTSDHPVAEEAFVTLEFLGHRPARFYDIGVAGLHRTLRRLPEIRQQDALVVVAGMEAALPSVLGGLVARPMVAVPTSVGYGAHLQGLTAFLGMLNSCAPGITVVNIDNGFGAAYAIHRLSLIPSANL